VRYLEDNEELELAKAAKMESRGSKPLRQLRKEIGLDG